MQQETEPLFLEDGMTREFRIPRDPGIHGTLTGERRMTTDKEVQHYSRQTTRYYEQKNPAAAEALRNKTIADKLVSWNVTRKGEDTPVEITPENVARLQPILLTRLESVVLGIHNDGTTDAEELDATTGN